VGRSVEGVGRTGSLQTCARASVDVQSISGRAATFDAAAVAWDADLIASSVVVDTAADANCQPTQPNRAYIDHRRFPSDEFGPSTVATCATMHQHAVHARIKPRPHQQQCRNNIRLCWQKRQLCRFTLLPAVSWSLTSSFSTNMSKETKGQGWRAIPTQYRKASDILTSTLAAFLFSNHPKKESDREVHLNYYASRYSLAPTTGEDNNRSICSDFVEKMKFRSTLLPKTVTQCRSNIRLCRKNSTCIIRQRCFDTVTGVNGALFHSLRLVAALDCTCRRRRYNITIRNSSGCGLRERSQATKWRPQYNNRCYLHASCSLRLHHRYDKFTCSRTSKNLR